MNKHKGSSLDNFLKEENILEETEAVAIKRVIAYEFEKKMKKTHLSKTKLAKKMHTSRSAVNRILDPSNTSITLNTLVKTANCLGKKLNFSIK